MARIGKIARLPRALRAQLNLRLQDGEEGKELVLWLNSLPEVKAVLAKNFASRPINEQNLSDWRRGGFEQWLAQQDLLALAGDLAADRQELEAIAPGLSVTDHLTQALSFRYAALLASQGPALDDPALVQIKALSRLCQGVVKLRRCEQDAARLKIQTQRWEQASAQKAAEQAESLKARQREELAAPIWAALKKGERLAQFGGGPAASFAADYLAEIETCPDPAHFQSKVLTEATLPEIIRQTRERAKNPPVRQTPAQAAMEMYEQFDDFLARQKSKKKPVPPESKPSSPSRKPAQRRPSNPAPATPNGLGSTGDSPVPVGDSPTAPTDVVHVPSEPAGPGPSPETSSPGVAHAIKPNQA